MVLVNLFYNYIADLFLYYNKH